MGGWSRTRVEALSLWGGDAPYFLLHALLCRRASRFSCQSCIHLMPLPFVHARFIVRTLLQGLW